MAEELLMLFNSSIWADGRPDIPGVVNRNEVRVGFAGEADGRTDGEADGRTDGEADGGGGIRKHLPLQYLLGISYGLIILLSLLGNLAVILAVMSFQQLKSLNHYLLMSLAAADLTVTVLVMPFALIQDISGEWGQSRTFCLFWMSWDVMCCTASLQHLCAVAWDRYVAITDPYNYPRRMTITKVIIIIVAIWTVSALISFLPIFMGWFTNAVDTADTHQCFLETNRYYAVASALISFYLPFAGMAYCYYRIFGIVRQKIEMNQLQQRSIVRSSIRAALLEVDGATASRPDLAAEVGRRVTSGFAMRDLKATKTLGIVFGMFFFCWWPFFILYWVDAFLTTDYIPQPAHSVITWLGYLNSALNPIIYSWNPIFRAAYKQLFAYMIAPCTRDTALNGLITPSPSDLGIKLGTRHPSASSAHMGILGMQEEDIRELELIFWPPQRPIFRHSTSHTDLLTVPRRPTPSSFRLAVQTYQPLRRRSYAVPGEHSLLGNGMPQMPLKKSHEFEDGMEALLGSRIIDASKFDEGMAYNLISKQVVEFEMDLRSDVFMKKYPPRESQAALRLARFSPTVSSADLGLQGANGDWCLFLGMGDDTDTISQEPALRMGLVRSNSDYGEMSASVCYRFPSCTREGESYPVTVSHRAVPVVTDERGSLVCSHLIPLSEIQKFLGENDDFFVEALVVLTVGHPKPSLAEKLSVVTAHGHPFHLPDLEDANVGDYTLISADGLEFVVHTDVLAERSQFLASVFEDDRDHSEESTWNPGSRWRQGRCILSDISGNTLSVMLDFIYSGAVKDVPKNAESLYKAADKCGLLDLREVCLKTCFTCLRS
ncbi:putative Beta-2 adrenergic receptor [Hypsibius exemplaris]|uniref:Beta-2 adrenergic receptor n=1 Tax=Hypsibius exemplaris TaxID=2072580 RepID=A0A1W0X0K5_HYPEX|nr:putative Beta-2 adrenergic receptor [Hypsibius exemplaris]